VLVASNGVDPFEIEVVARYEDTLLRSNAAGVKIRALFFCKLEFRVHVHLPVAYAYTVVPTIHWGSAM
jgi:hypothetical protein